jgi:hypothetical protein
VPLVVPEVPLVVPDGLPLPEPIWAFFKTNFSLAVEPVALLVDPVALVPLVPVELPDMDSAFCRHPVTVMLLPL